MMKAPDHMHAQAWLEPGDTIHVRLDAPGNVLLMDDVGHGAYLRGESFSYIGGWVKKDRITFWPPHPGSWHVVIDQSDEEGRISASVQIMRG